MNKSVILLFAFLFAVGCVSTDSKHASPTFGEAFFSDESQLVGYYNPAVALETVPLDSGWIFLGKDSIPGIAPQIPVLESGEEIKLPHRLTAANHNFWYKAKVTLEPGVLLIDADDGAQLWVNGERIPRSERGEFFEISDSGEKELLIRAVNNAMAGGLRKVTWISQEEFLNREEKKLAIQDSIFLERKSRMLKDQNLSSKLADLSIDEKKIMLEEYPILLTEPVLLLGTDGSYFLRWISEKAGIAKLTFAGGIEKEVKSEDGVFTFEPEGNELEFSLHQENSNFGNFAFAVPKLEDGLKLAIWGDSQGGWKTFAQIAKQIQGHQPDLNIGAGDLVNNGSEEFAYPRFLQTLSLMKTPTLPVPGNHDYDGFYEDLEPDLMKKFLFRPNEPTYGMQLLGPLAVITLDPNVNFPVSIPGGTTQRTWFESAIESEAWKAATWKMIVLHQPPYSQGWPGYHGETSIQDLLEPYFHRGLVDLVVTGHTHDYERLTRDFSGNPVTFLIVGGAGGGLEPNGKISEFPQMDKLIKTHHFGILEVKKEGLNWEVFGVDGELLDRYLIEKAK
ncbi:metallophosphoesterase family protein [Algoriphagus litoralis]|uniref:metallophosphoesterase family protein n=1 Tax=Algoriphagus litoralis TaxID=2202829 RepID=UPI000DB96C30|nr:metallophosphoesterase [Algoriphagus litoralis]